MTETLSTTIPNYGMMFDGCPNPCGIIRGDAIVAANAAFRLHYGDALQSLRSCIDAADHEKLPKEIGGPVEFIARPAAGANAGKRIQWTAWPMGDGLACVRMDGPAPIQSDIPDALAPLFAEPLSIGGMIAGKMFERIDAAAWVIAKDGTILVSDGGGLVHFGIKPGQIVGLNAFQIYPPDSGALNDVHKVLAGQQIRDDELASSSHWLRAIDPIRDEQGNVTAMVGLAWCGTDVTGEIRQAKALLGAMSELPVTVWAMDPDGTCRLSVGKALRDLGLKPGELVGKNLFQVYESSPQALDHLKRAVQGEHIAEEATMGDVTWFSTLLPVKDGVGQRVTQVYGVSENVTERSTAQKRIEEQLAIIRSQQDAIAALTSPIIEVWQGVLVVPLIGSLDADRAARLVEHLLAEVVRRQSDVVILDLTGISVVDPSTAQNLFDIMRSVRLLGAEGLVSGIRPNVAKTMVELDVASASWKTFPTLAEALRRFIGKRSRVG